MPTEWIVVMRWLLAIYLILNIVLKIPAISNWLHPLLLNLAGLVLIIGSLGASAVVASKGGIFLVCAAMFAVLVLWEVVGKFYWRTLHVLLFLAKMALGYIVYVNL